MHHLILLSATNSTCKKLYHNQVCPRGDKCKWSHDPVDLEEPEDNGACPEVPEDAQDEDLQESEIPMDVVGDLGNFQSGFHQVEDDDADKPKKVYDSLIESR